MGIRYFACAYPHELIDTIYSEPMLAMTVNPTVESWSAEHRTELPTLDLDKMWRSFQAVTAPAARVTGYEYPRPAYRMFEGHITEIYSEGIGWFPWLRVISPDETAVISRDLASLDPTLLAHAERYNYGPSEHLNESCAQFLRNARSFTEELAQHGHGFVYMIG